MEITLHARTFAAAWMNVWSATSDDEERPALFRTVMVEDLGDPVGVRLWATDSYILFRAAVHTMAEYVIEEDVQADAVYVVMDPDARAMALMKYVWKDATEKRKPDATITLTLGKSTSGPAPTLTPDLERDALVLTYEGERLTLDQYEGPPPEWRPIVDGHKPASVKNIGLGVDVALKPLSRIRSADGIVPPAEFTWGGTKGVAEVICRCRPYLRATVCPVQLED
jgi:hypothetical protein